MGFVDLDQIEEKKKEKEEIEKSERPRFRNKDVAEMEDNLELNF